MGLDLWNIMLLRAADPFLGIPVAVGEETHEASDQDLCPDVWTSGHVRRSRRSAGPNPGRRSDADVPTTTTPTIGRQMQRSRCSALDEIAFKPFCEVAARSPK